MRFHVPSPVSLLSTAIAAVLCVVLAPAASAQVTYSGGIVPVVTGLSSADSIAIDASGNIYVPDTSGDIFKETPAAGVYTQSLFTNIGGNGSPIHLALDSSGNAYVSYLNYNAAFVFNPTGSTISAELTPPAPLGMAADNTGSFYVCSGTNIVKETLLGGSGYSQSTVVTGLSQPTGVAVDASGNLYVTDPGAGQVYKETLSGGTYAQSTIASVTANGIAVDGIGNVYIADTGDGEVLKETVSGGTYTQSVLASGLIDLEGLALDPSGHVFVSDNIGGTISEIVGQPNLGLVNIGSPSSMTTLPFTVLAGTTVGSVSVLTTGLPNKDFVDAGSSTCTAQTYFVDTNCVVNISFAPRSPGLRRGAVVIADSSGNALATATIYGTAVGPQQEFFPSTTTVINAATSRPLMLAVDGNSSVFIPDANNGQIVKVTSAGVSSLLVSGLTTPTAVAVDGAGNLHVTNNATDVTTIAPNGTQSTVTVAGAANLEGIALDATGNQYVTDQNTGTAYKIASDGTQSTFASGFTSANGVAVDTAGNVYVSSTSDGTISQITPAGVKTSVATGLNGPEGLAVDAAGDVYYAQSGTSTIGEVPSGGSPTTLQTNASGTPVGLAIDSSGDLFFSDTALATVSRLNRQTPPTLAFASTVAGVTSSGSPKIAAMQNTGNAPLTIASVVYPVDFPEDAVGSGTDCVAGPLATSGVCTFFVDFKPTSAGGTGTTVNLLEAIKVTTDGYNRPGTLFRVALTGTETKRASSLVLSASSLTPLIGSGYTITATASGGGPTPTGTVTFYSGNVFLTSGTLNGSGAATITGTLPSGLHTITATYGGDANYITSTAAPLKVTVQKMTTSVSVVSSVNPAVSGTSITFTATVPTTLTGVAPTGKVSFMYNKVLVGQATIVNGPSNTATFTTSSLTATHDMTVTYLGDVNYASVSNTVGVRETITPAP